MKEHPHPISIPVLAEETASMPSYGSPEAAGADLRAHLEEPLTIFPGDVGLVPTGLCLEIPHGFEVQIRPRSGLALKNQITVLNTPGTIDSDYRGEVKILLINHGKEPFIVEPGMRVAQMVLAPCYRAHFVKKLELAESQRGCGGFGHSGLH